MSSIFALFTLFMKETMFFVAYIKNNAFPQPLSIEKEIQYIEQKEQGDEEARNKLIEHNLRLVAHIVKKFNHTGESMEDLISIGTIGLIKGVESYRTNKGTKLATYAARCIENEILMYLRTLKKTQKDISLHSPIGSDFEGNEISLIDVIEADNVNIFDKVRLQMDIMELSEHFYVLDKREFIVITDRFGLNNAEELTQREIAKKLNISRSYVSRIEKRALMKVLRSYIQEKQHIH